MPDKHPRCSLAVKNLVSSSYNLVMKGIGTWLDSKTITFILSMIAKKRSQGRDSESIILPGPDHYQIPYKGKHSHILAFWFLVSWSSPNLRESAVVSGVLRINIVCHHSILSINNWLLMFIRDWCLQILWKRKSVRAGSACAVALYAITIGQLALGVN